MVKIRALFALVLTAAIVGCSDGNGDGKSAGGPSRPVSCAEKNSAAGKSKPSRYPVDNLDPTSVVIRVGSAAITQQDYEDWYHLRVRMFCEANRISVKSKDDRLARVQRDSRNRAWNELIRRELLRQESERLGAKANPVRLATLQKRFMKQIKHGKEDFSKIDSIFGAKDAALVRGYLESTATEDACLDASTTNDISRVTDEELGAQIKFIADWNARADESNKVQRARAEAAKKEILGGKYFYDVTTNRADLAHEHGKEWQVVELDDLDSEDPLLHWLVSANQGDISDPIDLEDGLAIVGLRFKYKEDDEDPESPVEYDLVKCTFYAFEKMEEPEDREQLRKDMLLEKRSAAMRALGERLVAETKVEFPHGEKIFREQTPNAVKKTKKAPKGAKKAPQKDDNTKTDEKNK